MSKKYKFKPGDLIEIAKHFLLVINISDTDGYYVLQIETNSSHTPPFWTGAQQDSVYDIEATKL